MFGQKPCAPDVESIYDVPINFEKDCLSDVLLERLNLKGKRKDLREWHRRVQALHRTNEKVKIGVVGKYFKTGDYVLSDAYISVIEALKHAAYATRQKPELVWLDAIEYERDPKKLRELKGFDGILIPGGFGSRGVEGKIRVIEYCRVNKIPYFGLCYGMQLLVIEYARHILGLAEATTHEINPKAEHRVIDIMPEQKERLAHKDYGGSMRLGEYEAKVSKGTQAYRAYKAQSILERHRHRYEVSPLYVERLREAGLIFSGTSPDGVLMEIAELPKDKHPFFLATQFHPEFQSSLTNPHPLFVTFLKACRKR